MTIKTFIMTIIFVITTRLLYIENRGDVMKTRLRELRARNGFNQTELARRAKISRQTVSLIEREEYIPSLLIAKRMAKIFDEPIESIFIFEEEEI